MKIVICISLFVVCVLAQSDKPMPYAVREALLFEKFFCEKLQKEGVAAIDIYVWDKFVGIITRAQLIDSILNKKTDCLFSSKNQWRAHFGEVFQGLYPLLVIYEEGGIFYELGLFPTKALEGGYRIARLIPEH